MSMDFTGINNFNEYYTQHYFASIFEENAAETISGWRAAAKEEEEARVFAELAAKEEAAQAEEEAAEAKDAETEDEDK